MSIITTDVLVVGAGPTGLTTANLLVRSGIKVVVLDKKTGPTEETRALVVHAKTLELLDKLDLARVAVQEGKSLGAVELLKVGKHVGQITFMDDRLDDRTPYPLALIYTQSQMESLLLKNLEAMAGRIEWCTELLDLKQIPGKVQTTIRSNDGIEKIIEAKWVVGADGAHSPVRHALSLGFAGKAYEQPLFVADVDLEWDRGTQRAHMDLTHLGFFAFFPMSGEQQFRLLGSIPPELSTRESLTLDDIQHVLNTLSGLKVNLLKARWISVYRTHHRISERFHVDRVFLVGDAAHIHSPAGGQGMNTGIGDAYNLAWKLALVVKGHAHESFLDSYEAERIPFARAILQGSDRGFYLQATTNQITQQLKLFAVPLLFRLISLLPSLRRWAFWLLSQLWTSYRNSPAVAESGPVKKGPQAGDRAPHGFFEVGPDAGESIFSKLKGLNHHLILFAGSKQASALTNTYSLEEKLRSLLYTYKIQIHLHVVSTGNQNLHERYGADTPGLFLIRPDGQIAYRGQAENLSALQSYLDKVFVKQKI